MNLGGEEWSEGIKILEKRIEGMKNYERKKIGKDKEEYS